ncbi:MAG: hypothetical protein D6708_03285 [Candidatus Dadabacteria bacterium]|nr:MAG: hypothetical protein D6708_03285 [Candidatus Dadabacteria bacterium]
MEAVIADAGDLGDPPRLFWFDPDQGLWVEQADAGCSRTDAQHVTCQLRHFSQYGGGGAVPPQASGQGYDSARSDTDRAAQEELEKTRQRQEQGEQTDVCDTFTAAVADALMAEVEAALAYADAHPSEAAKAKLLDTAARMELMGWFSVDGGTGCGSGTGPEWQGWNAWEHSDNPAGDLIEAAKTVTERLADEVTQGIDCPDIDRLEKIMAEAQLFGMTDLFQALESIYLDLLDRCDVIEGTIEYVIVLPQHPSDLAWWSWEAGTRVWTETHQVSLVLHGSSGTAAEDFGTFDGKDTVATEFPEARYRHDIDEPYCGFETYETEALRGVPASAGFEVSVNGNVRSGAFEVEGVTASGGIDLGTDNFQVDWEYTAYDPIVCERKPDITWNYDVTYRGQIAEEYSIDTTGDGTLFFVGVETPLPTLWEILNDGPVNSTPTLVQVGSGSYPRWFYNGQESAQDVFFPAGIGGTQVFMTWHLEHTDYTRGQ